MKNSQNTQNLLVMSQLAALNVKHSLDNKDGDLLLRHMAISQIYNTALLLEANGFDTTKFMNKLNEKPESSDTETEG